MNNLLMQLDKNAGKIAYVELTLRYGIETINVLIPLDNVPKFELQMRGNFTSKQTILDIVKKCAGEVK